VVADLNCELHEVIYLVCALRVATVAHVDHTVGVEAGGGVWCCIGGAMGRWGDGAMGRLDGGMVG